MLPLFARIVHALVYDEAAFKRWAFGFFGFLASLAPAVFVDGVEVAFTWSRRQWAIHLATSFVAWAVAMVNPAGKLAPAPAPGASLGYARLRTLGSLVLLGCVLYALAWLAAL